MAIIGQYIFPTFIQVPVSMSSLVMNESKNTGVVGAIRFCHCVPIEEAM